MRGFTRTVLLLQIAIFCGPRALGAALLMLAYCTLEPWLLSWIRGGATRGEGK